MKNLVAGLVAAALLLPLGAAHAQVGLPGEDEESPGGPGGGAGGAIGVPVDGGATLLLAGGLTYGLRRLRQRRQPQA